MLPLRTYGSTPRGVLHKKPHNGVRIDCRIGLRYESTLAQLAEPGKSARTAYFAQKGIRRQNSALQQPKHFPWRPNVSRRCQNTSQIAFTVPSSLSDCAALRVSWGRVTDGRHPYREGLVSTRAAPPFSPRCRGTAISLPKTCTITLARGARAGYGG